MARSRIGLPPEDNLLSYLRKLLHVGHANHASSFHRALRRHTQVIDDLLERELPSLLSLSEKSRSDALCQLLYDFFSAHWPEEHCASMQSFATTPLYAVPVRGTNTIFTWPTDGQYFVGQSGRQAEYFIHRDLQAFLQRELKLFLAFREEEDIPTEIRERFSRVCHHVFAVLAQVETELKNTFEGPFVVGNSGYCLPLSRIPRHVHPQVMRNRKQREEWYVLHDIDVPSGDAEAFWSDHPKLIVDTGNFSNEFLDDLKGSGVIDDARLDGTLINGDNLEVMRMLSPDMRGTVRCIYVDPPYNTGGKGFLYHDDYAQDAWLSMMDNRLEFARDFLTEDGSIFVQIDYNQKEALRFLLDRYFTYHTEIIWRIGWISGFKSTARKFIRNHDTIYHYASSHKPYFQKRYIPYPSGYVRRDGSPPKGEGYPLEDTWNCSDIDRLDSIQIKSFSKEKVGARALTQKNEDLLERIIGSTTQEGDLVMDYFAGTGTTCAAAHKMGRRWIGIEQGEWFDTHLLPRMKKVLAGEPYGISGKYGWKGGGMFRYCTRKRHDSRQAI